MSGGGWQGYEAGSPQRTMLPLKLQKSSLRKWKERWVARLRSVRSGHGAAGGCVGNCARWSLLAAITDKCFTHQKKPFTAGLMPAASNMYESTNHCWKVCPWITTSELWLKTLRERAGGARREGERATTSDRASKLTRKPPSQRAFPWHAHAAH